MTVAAAPRTFPSSFIRLAFCAALLALLAAPAARAQTSTSVTDGSTPSALTPGTPVGSYPLSDFESVNLYNGNLNFALPLLRTGGRGSVGVSVTLKVERHWRVKTLKPLPNCQLTGVSCDPSHFPDFNGWIISPDYGPGVLVGRQPGSTCGGGQGLGLTRLTFKTGDGTEYELRDRDYGGQPKSYPCAAETGHLRGAVFVTADGTAATFTSDTAIYDTSSTSPRTIRPAGVLKLRDGTVYRIDEGLVTWVRDRNGNRVNYTYEGQRVKTITDTLGRVVTFNYNVSDVAPYGVCDQIVYKGFGGADRVVRVSRTNLASVLRTTRAGDSALPKKVSELFPEFESSSSANFNPIGIVSAVWLPDDGVNRRAYKFFYNVYGELARVELPTGGATEYDFVKYSVTNDGIFRGVAERRVYADGVNLEGRTAYSLGASPRTVDAYDAGGTLLTRSKHYFHGNPLDSLVQQPTDYSGWREGREYKTEHFGVTNGVAAADPLRRVEQEWRQRAPVSWWTGTAEKEPANDPRVVETVTTVEPGGANLVIRQSAINPQTGAVGFDQFNNPTDLWEYDYGQGGAVRHTHTDYVTTNNGVNYTAADGAHLRGLSAGQQVYAINPQTGAETPVAKSETRYDEAVYPLLTCGTANNPITCGSAPQWDDLGTTPRGNPTTTRQWLDTTNTWPETHAQYDQLGNVRYTWDAKGNLSQVSYLDAFCNGNGCGGTYTPNTFAFPSATKSPKPDPSGTYGSAAELTSSTVYDFYTGLAYSSTDANHQTTSFEYDDPLDRPTAQVRPDGGRTDIYYSQPNESLYVRTLTDLEGTRRLKSEQHFDGMGRPYRSFTWEGQAAATPWLTVDTLYDALGRAWKTSSPYRSAGPGSAADVNRAGTETTFDALGRITQVKTTADGAVVKTGYSGDRVLVTDQDGKQRLSKMDALGRLTEVWEVTPNDSAQYPGVETIPPAMTTGLLTSAHGYRTEYFYDSADNLRRVKQGAQERFFAYDSLGRLVRAKNPERGAFTAGGDFPTLIDPISGNGQWSIGYVYDANGNLTKRKDAWDVTAAYAYDALNRNTAVSYADDPTQTPTAHRHYDGSVGGLGRFWYSSAGATATGINEYDAVGRVREQHQNFQTGGVWSPDYSVKLEYNKAGGVTSMTYPSGRKVEYQYDAAGRLGDNGGLPAFKGNLGDGGERTYASQVLYDELGGMSQERFGTQTPVYNKHFYNSRGQLGEIRLSTYSITNTDLNLKTNWNRGAIISHYSATGWGATGGGADNNGHLRQQDVFIPKIDGAGYDQGGNHDIFTQNYDYDALNRLRGVTEAGRWRQQYAYDRWGNRTINAAATQVYELNALYSIPEPQFSVDAGTNRLGVPEGQPGQMDYDAAGNLTLDTYQGGQGGGGTRAYDAENRMISAQFVAGQQQTASYVYDADGRRVKRGVGTSAEAWQVYGIGGELLAEYAPGAAPNQPRKEYGYRGGELLVTASAGTGQPQPQPQRANVALASSGATAAGSSQYSASFPAASAINGDRYHLNAAGGVYNEWHSAAGAAKPDWLEVTFAGPRTIDEVDVFTQQDDFNNPVEPTLQTTFSTYGLTQYEVQYWTGSQWAAVPGGSVSGNDKVWRKFTFPAVVTSKVRVSITASADGYSRVFELEAWGWEGRSNVALAANGGVATASSSYNSPPWVFTPAGANDGDRRGANWGSGGGWNDAGLANTFPGWLQVDFAGAKTIDEIDVFTGQDNWSGPSEPTEAMTFTQYGLTQYEVQYKDGANWATVQGGSISGNNRVWRKFTFPAVVTTGVRVRITASADGYSRVAELEAWGTGAGGTSQGADVRWLVADQLGTPRMVVDKTGSLTGVTRHDYLPFGEEMFAGTGGRTPTHGYSAADYVRQKFTGKERDDETALQYFFARYYSSTQGRFISTDPEGAGAKPTDPQSWNAYGYARSSPLVYSDPDGREYLVCDPKGKNCSTISDEAFYKARRGDKEGEYTGNRDFFESGQYKVDGEVLLTYVQISIDDQVRQNIFAIRRAVAPIPKGTLAFFGLGIAGGTTGGVAYYLLAPAAGSTVTTLGLGAAAEGTTGTTAATVAPQAASAIRNAITGYTKHGINSAISHDGVGVSTRVILETVKNPIKVIAQSGGRVKIVGKDATVILNQAGKVITTWARNSGATRIQ